jgi:hypothetical protein
MPYRIRNRREAALLNGWLDLALVGYLQSGHLLPVELGVGSDLQIIKEASCSVIVDEGVLRYLQSLLYSLLAA